MNDFTYVVGRPIVMSQKRFYSRLESCFERGKLSNYGPMVQQLEQIFAEKVGYKHNIAVANATLGLGFAVASTCSEQTTVMSCPTFTFIAAANVIRLQGLKVYFKDCENGSPNTILDTDLPSMHTNLFGSYWSHPQATVIDSAHGIRNTKILNGGIEVFSFHATKMIQGFEGGMVCTNNDEQAAFIRSAINFGYDHSPHFVKDLVNVGVNAKMSEVHAAMALTNYEFIDYLIHYHKCMFKVYEQCIAEIPGVKLAPRGDVFDNYSYVPIIFDTKLARDKAQIELHKEGIGALVYFKPIHLLARMKGISFPNAEDLYNRILCLPTGTQVNESSVKQICMELKRALG